MRGLRRASAGGLVAVAVIALLLGLVVVRTLPTAGGATASAGGLSVFVGYAEDKEIETPNPAAFPVPWAGSPGVTFLGGTVPGQGQCGTLSTCYDAGAIRLDNPTAAPITVSQVSVDDHSSLPGGKVFDNLWGSFTVPPGQSVILTENPPASNPAFDNFDTSSFPPTCTPMAVAPTVTLTIGGVATTLTDSTHVLDTTGIDLGSCPPDQNESIQWRPIGSAGASQATLSLGPAAVTAVAGASVTETATLLDGSGQGLPHAVVAFSVTSGPDAGTTGTAATDANGHASFTFSGTPGEDTVVAQVTTVGSFSSAPTQVLWTDDSSAGWTGSDIGSPSPPGGQSFSAGSGAWTVSGGGTGPGGTADQLHLVSKPVGATGGAEARVTALTGGSAATAGVMLRSGTAPGSPSYGALVTPAGSVEVLDRAVAGGPTSAVVTTPVSLPAFLWVARSGTTLTTYTSPDGTTWTPLPGSAASFDLGGAAVGGLAVSSGQPGVLASGTFDSVAVTASPPPPLPPVSCPSPFSCADIGGPTPAGNQSYDPNSGTWTVSGGGSDISGSSDQFRFVSQPLTGDGTVQARVVTQSNSNSQAKAGVMVRATTDPGSPEYSVVVSPGAGIKVQLRSTQGGTTTKLANPAGTVPAYLEITRTGSSFTASTSPDGVTWTTIAGSGATLALGSTVLAGLAVTSHTSGQLGTVTFDSVSPGVASSPPPTSSTTSSSTTSTSTTSTSTTSTTTTTGTPLSCPTPYTCADLGSPLPAGNQSYDPSTGTWTITAGGADIFGTTDQFRFISEPLTGDGTISARVVSQTRTSTNTKAGVMIRASADPSSPEYSVVVTSGAGIKVQVRTKQGGGSTTLANPSGVMPAFLAVTRTGSTFTASTSPDGATWTAIPGSATTLSVGATALMGLCVTSHNSGTPSTAVIDSVTTS